MYDPAVAKPTEVPTPIATTTNYPAEVYPATYPAGHPNAGEAHPSAGAPVPWSGALTKDPAVEAAWAALGMRPGKPVPAPGWNSRGSKIDAWLSWLLSGTFEATEGAHIVETDDSGEAHLVALEVGQLTAAATDDGPRILQIVGGYNMPEGPRAWASHSAEDAWMASYLVAERTFALPEATVPAAPYHLYTTITDTDPGNETSHFTRFPSSCVVSFRVHLLAVIGDGSMEVADLFDYTDRTRVLIFSRSSGVWVGMASSGDVDSHAGANAIAIVGDVSAGRVRIRATFNATHDGKVYRGVYHVTCRVLEIDD